MRRVVAIALVYVYLASLMQACGLGPPPAQPRQKETADRGSARMSSGRAAPTIPIATAPVIPSDAILPTDNDGAAAPLTPGGTAGKLVVTEDGEATYRIPLWVPPGRNGIQPELSLYYKS